MEDFKTFNIKTEEEDINSEIEFDSELLIRSKIDFLTNKQKYNKNRGVSED